MRIIKDIPTNIVFGFLGVGKTTAILDWMRQKPDGQSWSVLVNEFGAVGIDGALYEREGISVKEIPGGCMCCAQGVPLQVAVNRLLRETVPDRLLIETSGIGHPLGVMNTLQGDGFRGVLDLRAIVGIVDPEQLLSAAYLQNELFTQQLALSDVLVANKTDLASPRAMGAFENLADQFVVPKALATTTMHAHMKPEWLDLAHTDRTSDLRSVDAVARRAGQWRSFHWRFPVSKTFDLQALQRWITSLDVVRVKGMVNAVSGSHLVQYAAGNLSIVPAGEPAETRLQIIDWPAADTENDADREQQLEQGLASCVRST